MQKVVGVAIALCGVTLGGCVNVSRLTAQVTHPMEAGALEASAAPPDQLANAFPVEDEDDLGDPVRRSPVRGSPRQVNAGQTAPARAATLSSQTRASPATTGAAGSPVASQAEPATADEAVRQGKERHELAIRVMEERIAERERAARRTLSGICTGC